MHDKKSIYVLNKKNSGSIIYTEKNEVLIRINRDDVDDPDSFMRLKAWSDENYHLEDNQNRVEDSHTISLEYLPESALAVEDAEAILLQLLERKQEQNEHRRKFEIVREALSEKQFKKFFLKIAKKGCKTRSKMGISEGILFPC